MEPNTNKKQRKITSYFKPIEPQPKIEIPKATETEKQVKLPSSFSTTSYEKGKSPFSVLLERNKKQQTKRRHLVKKKHQNFIKQYLKAYRRLL